MCGVSNLSLYCGSIGAPLNEIPVKIIARPYIIGWCAGSSTNSAIQLQGKGDPTKLSFLIVGSVLF